MQITINRGGTPNAQEVLTALANTVFYEDGSPWEPDTDQAAGLLELFGAGTVYEGNVVPINREDR
ncbi:hypothetical protein [Mycobacterium persicum]|uniref:hypothetical protein n=1 Tax=Mycobacterium persicum TaxID=1487726 RepID=UPI0015939360|nr:hypothetical protein [Mycobacterium persicum]